MVVGSVCCGITKSVLLEMGLGEGGCGDLHCSAVDGGIFRDARTTSGVSISRVIRHCLDKADMPGNAGGCSVFPLTFELTKINILKWRKVCIFQVIVTVSHAMSFGIRRIHIRIFNLIWVYIP